MLNSETKKRIDDCRDILVGKVPDPKSQIEQITIALIYKFMDDMDKEAVELGGERRFFSDGFGKYAWGELFKADISGDQRVDLYREAIEKMEENPHVPQLFRDIFKNAFLPYRDPETLREFLKYINLFRYDHSEQLGDAFEYLLSVLGSQGDAGQFRTPRHIIDLMAELVDPQKNETILDPACGTAGFLISCYKHILKQNSNNYDPKSDTHAFEMHGVKLDELTVDALKKYKGDKLTPDERIKLINNIKGYDISPDMVRLSLVNLYLHGFTDPHIFEYDTLTSEERWNEYYDVIMANPPFMSPKGGIRPHKRFSVESKRSEVLFVDYIAEHLTVNGRAAVIVPEGIIFQSGTAYKKLRKMLIEDNFLVGVISLPAGLFNPYAGVKTSILWLDKPRAKKTDKILFVKIENDGFDLGAQRRPIKLNDLSATFKGMIAYKQALDNSEHFDSDNYKLLNLVGKSKIAKNGDYNLSGERYKVINTDASEYSFKSLGVVCEFKRGPFGGSLKKEIFVDKGYAVYEQSHAISNNFGTVRYFISNEKFKEMKSFSINSGDLLMSCSGTMGKIGLVPKNVIPGIINQALLKLTVKENLYNIFLKLIMESDGFQKALHELTYGAAIKNVASVKILKDIQIPLPPLSVQEEIVAEIDSYQKIIDGAQQVVDNYKPRIDIDPEWPLVELGEVCNNFSNGVNFGRDQVGKGTRFINIKDLFSEGFINVNNLDRVLLSENEIKRKKVNENDILFVRSSVKYEGVGFPSLFKAIDSNPVVFCGFIIKATPKIDSISSKFLLFLLRTEEFRKKVVSLSNKANITNISQDNLKSLIIPLPDLEAQKQIVTRIEREQELVKANKGLITIYEQKIKERIARVWGE